MIVGRQVASHKDTSYQKWLPRVWGCCMLSSFLQLIAKSEKSLLQSLGNHRFLADTKRLLSYFYSHVSEPLVSHSCVHTQAAV